MYTRSGRNYRSGAGGERITGFPVEEIVSLRKGWQLVVTSAGTWLLTSKSISAMGLEPDSFVDPVEISKTAVREQTTAARSDTERFLSRSEHSAQQLRLYLAGRKYLEEVIDGTLEWAERNGLVDDRRYASIFIRSHSTTSPMGNFRIRMELKKRGIHDSITDELLSEREENELYRSLVKTVSLKYGHLKKETAIRRASAYLQRRGFRYELIGRIIEEALQYQEERED